MSAHKFARQMICRKRRQCGTAAIEVAFIMIPFLLIIFGIMELARSMFVVNTLQEVTRRAAAGAANSDFHEAALAVVRQQAVLRKSPGQLVLSDPVTDQHVRIEYLALIRNSDGSTTPTLIPTSSLPDSPEKNLAICAADSNAPTCIRLIRARVCDPGNTAECAQVMYKPLFPLIKLSMALPASTTIVPAQSLGYVPPACLPCGK